MATSVTLLYTVAGNSVKIWTGSERRGVPIFDAAALNNPEPVIALAFNESKASGNASGSIVLTAS